MKNLQQIKKTKKARRRSRIRAKIVGDQKRPRLAVFRSDKHVSAQLIDDISGKTLAAVSDFALGKKTVGKNKRVVPATPKDLGDKTNKVAIAYEVGKLIAEKAKKLGIEAVIFDRGGFAYHGRIKAVADGAREGGIKF
ncbi:50S ribosomal protein L18 [Patescibacteria group bacterium]|nr:50S ribosomal protein L18 [Patescibacteria group bacterium]